MKVKLSTQEKLWDLRRDHGYKLEDVASAIGVAPATLSNYENKENKELSLSVLTDLARFYDVSMDWLVGLTEVKDSRRTSVDELMLDDATLALLRSGRFNNRLLCEIIRHEDFPKLMADTEIYADGIAAMQIKNMNDWLDAIRAQIIRQKNPDPDDFYLKVLDSTHIHEDEYFFHTIHEDWDGILRTIREAHQNAPESAPIQRSASTEKRVQRFLQTLKVKSNPIEEFWRFFCDEMKIKYENLSEQEHETMRNVLKKSKLLRSFPNSKNKARK